MALVSIVIPAYNAAHFLGQTLDSVMAQTHSDFEVWVVDDGSTDETAQIIAAYTQRDRRIQGIFQSNQGVAVARNRGIQSAQGEFIALLDADDLWHPQKLEKQLRVFQQCSERVGLVYCGSALIDAQGYWNGGYISFDFAGEVQAAIAYFNFIGHASAPLIRRGVFDQVGGFDEDYHRVQAQGCEDWDLYHRIARQYQFATVPDLLVGYRQQRAAMSAQVDSMLKSNDLVQSRHLNPQLPSHLTHWSRSLFCLHLATLKTSPVEALDALRLLWQALTCDLWLLINLQFHRTCLKVVLPWNLFSWGMGRWKRQSSEPQPLGMEALVLIAQRPLKRRLFNQVLVSRINKLQRSLEQVNQLAIATVGVEP